MKAPYYGTNLDKKLDYQNLKYIQFHRIRVFHYGLLWMLLIRHLVIKKAKLHTPNQVSKYR